jgi:hypothetical protein
VAFTSNKKQIVVVGGRIGNKVAATDEKEVCCHLLWQEEKVDKFFYFSNETDEKMTKILKKNQTNMEQRLNKNSKTIFETEKQ